MNFQIPEQNLNLLTKKIADLSKVAQKLGLASPTIEIGEKSIKQDPETDEVQVLYTVTVEGGAPKLGGYTAVAALDQADNGSSFVRRIDGDESPLPAEFRTFDPQRCDHCNKRRARIRSYVLRADDGKMLQVGSACVRDFTGHTDPLRVAAYFERLYAELEGVRRGQGGEANPYVGSIERALVTTFAVIRTNGWMSKTKARELYESGEELAPAATADIVANRFSRGSPRATELVEQDLVNAEAAISWVRGLTAAQLDASDYLHNIHVIVDSGVVRWNQLGFACSIAAAYLREQAKAAARAEKKNEFVGEVGKRQDFTLKCVYVRTAYSDFGTTFIYGMEDKEGRAFVWFTGNGSMMQEGDEIAVKGTVKDHNLYNGRCQTVLTRCKVQECCKILAAA